jgi:hypothetical protein
MAILRFYSRITYLWYHFFNRFPYFVVHFPILLPSPVAPGQNCYNSPQNKVKKRRGEQVLNRLKVKKTTMEPVLTHCFSV